ncbi:hypothetical protein PoB_001373000 [Plakobranchus ocellatus]|uniref:Uncharacterized protein n=1 Tax=Plakobranchus ocellatus TaxID=259542 RepID=A0AAV3YWF0_9GAST|nr:hypothetical protein PoB_001373000 [Plakobranchus ocellatus]
MSIDNEIEFTKFSTTDKQVKKTSYKRHYERPLRVTEEAHPSRGDPVNPDHAVLEQKTTDLEQAKLDKKPSTFLLQNFFVFTLLPTSFKHLTVVEREPCGTGLGHPTVCGLLWRHTTWMIPRVEELLRPAPACKHGSRT